ncbi:Exported zinc metalloprotease YfgC precursor [hydrothermal vent metagenome]|uniref:Exported zinc metalloprotease YfgC n=1 Tax=hydrothermal vent metagenome TaxID=652676 RepID=A0A3B1BI68_9ZZZZ
MTQITNRLSHWLLGIAIGVLASLPASADEDIRLPEIGAPSGVIITPAQERRLGRAFMRSVRNHYPVITDPLMSDYIQSLGNRLASHSSASGQTFNFFLIDNDVVNAFAGPAGHIGIFTGLLLTTETESELASVVAHEIAHVSQKHLVRTFDEVSRMNLPMAALTLAAVLVGGGSQLGSAAMAGLQAGMVQNQINFTRANENEADRIGIKTLAETGFDPRSMPVFFERMGRAGRFVGSELPEFLRTHPITINRIAESRGRAETYPYRQYPADTRYYLLRATLKEKQHSNPKDAVLFFQKTLTDGRYRNEIGQRYGYVLALIRNRDYKTARSELDKLLKAEPQQIAFQIAEANLYQASGDLERAIATLKDALELSPGNYPLTMSYTQTLLYANQPALARATLEKLAPTRPYDASMYEVLAQATGDSGDVNLAHEYLASHYYLSGRLIQAKQHLEIALRDTEISLFRGERMSAQLKRVQRELAELNQRK